MRCALGLSLSTGMCSSSSQWLGCCTAGSCATELAELLGLLANAVSCWVNFLDVVIPGLWAMGVAELAARHFRRASLHGKERWAEFFRAHGYWPRHWVERGSSGVPEQSCCAATQSTT